MLPCAVASLCTRAALMAFGVGEELLSDLISLFQDGAALLVWLSKPTLMSSSSATRRRERRDGQTRRAPGITTRQSNGSFWKQIDPHHPLRPSAPRNWPANNGGDP